MSASEVLQAELGRFLPSKRAIADLVDLAPSTLLTTVARTPSPKTLARLSGALATLEAAERHGVPASDLYEWIYAWDFFTPMFLADGRADLSAAAQGGPHAGFWIGWCGPDNPEAMEAFVSCAVADLTAAGDPIEARRGLYAAIESVWVGTWGPPREAVGT